MPDQPHTLEVAVTPEGKVALNFRDLPRGDDGWMHLSFTVEEATVLIETLKAAARAASAYQMARES